MDDSKELPDRLRDRAQKLVALATDGRAADGERAVAITKLQALADRHGVSLDSLLQDGEKLRRFRYKNRHEKDLLIHCFAMIRPDMLERSGHFRRGMIMRERGARTVFLFKLSEAQYWDLFDAFEFYRDRLAKHLDRATGGFIVAHKIGLRQVDDHELSRKDLDEMRENDRAAAAVNVEKWKGQRKLGKSDLRLEG